MTFPNLDHIRLDPEGNVISLSQDEVSFIKTCAESFGVDVTMISENQSRDLVAIEDAIEAAFNAGAKSGIENFSKAQEMMKKA